MRTRAVSNHRGFFRVWLLTSREWSLGSVLIMLLGAQGIEFSWLPRTQEALGSTPIAAYTGSRGASVTPAPGSLGQVDHRAETSVGNSGASPFN